MASDRECVAIQQPRKTVQSMTVKEEWVSWPTLHTIIESGDLSADDEVCGTATVDDVREFLYHEGRGKALISRNVATDGPDVVGVEAIKFATADVTYITQPLSEFFDKFKCADELEANETLLLQRPDEGEPEKKEAVEIIARFNQ